MKIFVPPLNKGGLQGGGAWKFRKPPPDPLLVQGGGTSFSEELAVNRRDLLKTLPMLATALGMPKALLADGEQVQGKPRLLTGICAYSFREALQNKTMSYDDLVRLAVELDVDGLDLTVYWFPNTSNEFLLPLRRLAYKMAVEIYSISVRTDMCRPTAELQAMEVEETKKWVDVAEKLGAGHVRVFGGEVPKGASEDQASQWVVEILKRAAEYAGKKGIILGLENHGGITEKAQRVIQIVKQVDSPWVGINLDTGNFPTHPYSQVEACVPYAVNVQLKAEMEDNGKKFPADWDRVLTVFAKAGYRGYLALEYEAAENPKTAVPRLIRRLQEMIRKYSSV